MPPVSFVALYKLFWKNISQDNNPSFAFYSSAAKCAPNPNFAFFKTAAMERKVKSITSYTYDFEQFGVLRAQDFRKYIRSVEEFDEQGNIIRQVSYTEDGREEEVVVNRYDEKNRLVSQERSFVLNGTKEGVKVTHDDARGVTEEVRYYDGEPGDKVVAVRNADGDMTEQAEYDEDGQLVSRQVYEYEAKGRVSREQHFDEDGRLTREVRNRYDEAGRLAEQRVEFPDEPEQNYTLRIDYSDPGRHKGLAVLDSGEIRFETLDVFDSEGRVVESQYTDLFTPEESWHMKRAFGKDGKVVFREHYDGNGILIQRYDYVYEDGLLKADIFFRFNPYTGIASKHRTVYEDQFFAEE